MHNVELMQTAEVAEALGLDRSAVTRLAKRGELPYVFKGEGIRGAYLFDRAEVSRFKTKREALLKRSAA